jgi:hypothetical protein
MLAHNPVPVPADHRHLSAMPSSDTPTRVAADQDAPQPYRPLDGVTLIGPFWTRRQTARFLQLSDREVRSQASLLRIEGGVCVEEAYPAFQFDDGAIRREVQFLARLLKRRVSDIEACDWLVRPRRTLDNRSPIDWLAADGDVDRVVRALPPPTQPVPGGVPWEREAAEIGGWIQEGAGAGRGGRRSRPQVAH